MNCKRCSCCKDELPVDKFRVRTDNRRSPPLLYYNNTCKECDKLYRKKHHENKKTDSEYINKNRNRVKKYREENRELILNKEKERKKSEAYKIYRKNYLTQNRDKINKVRKDASRRYTAKIIKLLSDSYVANHVPKNLRNCIDAIEMKRVEILIRRIDRKVKKLKNAK